MARVTNSGAAMAEGVPVEPVSVSGIGSARQSDAAYEAIRRAIVRCELMPGLIVSEAEIEARFVLKRAATRAALERLATQGLVRPLHRRGYEVRPITLRDLSELYQ